MSEDKALRIAQEIASLTGGRSNITDAYNCMTRVRLRVIDRSNVDITALEQVSGVLGVIHDGDMVQVVVGPGTAERVTAKLVEILAAAADHTQQNSLTAPLSGKDETARRARDTKEQIKAKQFGGWFRNILTVIASIFVPLIPAFVGAGLIGGIASVFQNLITSGSISADTWGEFVTVLNVIKVGFYGYLNIYVGISAARAFKSNEYVGGVVGGIVYLAGMNVQEPLINLITGQALSPGLGGVIGVIVAVYLLSVTEKLLSKVVPDSLDILVTPTVSLLMVGVATVYLIMPLAGTISSWLVHGVDWVLAVGGPFAGFLLGATFLPLVLFGLHQILTPIHVELIAAQGKTTLLPVLAMAGAGQVGAALALWVKVGRKNKRLSGVIGSALPVGILGIGEPLIYAVTLPLGKPFLTACLGGGVGGAVVASIGGIGATAVGPSGVALIPLIADGQWLGFIIGLACAYAAGFVLTLLFGIPNQERIEATFSPLVTGASAAPRNRVDA